jgi:uncharacterized protein (TIGR00369 family)
MSQREIAHEATQYRVPLHDALGITVVSAAAGEAVMAIDIDPQIHMGAGMVHGGLAPLLMDACAGLAVMSAIEGTGYVRATINLTAAYHRPILGGRMEARCRVVHVSQRHAHVSSEVWSEDRLCASGTITLVLAQGEFPGGRDGSRPSDVVRRD